MKLRDSMSEDAFRAELIRSQSIFFRSSRGLRLINVIKANFPDAETTHCIGHIPEQGEDIYTLLIDTAVIAKIEIHRYTNEETPIVERMSIDEYKLGLSKINQIQIQEMLRGLKGLPI